MIRSAIPVLLVLLSASCFASPSSDSFITGTDLAYIDWTKGAIVVTGSADIPEVVKDPDDYRFDASRDDQPRNMAQARLLAKEAAFENALKAAAALVADIHVGDRVLLSDAMKNPVVDNKINSYIGGNYKKESLVMEAMECSVVLSWPLHGEKGLLALNDEPDFRDNFVNFGYEDLTNSMGKTNREAFGGLVISAPYLKLTPALAPRIVSESGRLVYGSSVVYAKDAMRGGMVGYSLSPFAPPKRMKPDSYHCTALDTVTFEGTDIVIADEDAAKILGNPLTIEALRRCRVVVLAAEKKR